MARKLYSYDPKADEHTVLASFEMNGKKLKVEWEPNTDWYRASIESGGIVVEGKPLYPKDGQAFFDALPKAYANSSTMYVKDA